jgi:dTDP-3,4-didehydro-2,6-dideoxy-alpha-D-glucose 3-reductase
MNNQKINIGILGCANIAKQSMIPAINNLKEYFILIGIAGRNHDKVDECAKENNTRAFYSYDQLIGHEELDAVYIPLPNALHAEWIEKALKQGLHVLVEKSMACSFDEVNQLNHQAEKSNLVLIENFQFRFHPQLQIIKNLLSNDAIGDLRCLRSSFGFPPFPDINNIRYNKELGGGALFDAGAYPVKISQIFLGHDIQVKAASLKVDNNIGVDIWGGGFLQQKESPLFAEIAFGFDQYYQCNVELWGSKGKISASRIFTSPKDFRPEIILENSNGKEIIKVDEACHFTNMLMHFYILITTKKQVKDEYIQNVNQARLLEEFLNLAQ